MSLNDSHSPEDPVDSNAFKIPAFQQAKKIDHAVQQEQEQQQASVPPPVPPPRRLAPEEKLLKRIPDEVQECTKLPDGVEPTVIEIAYPTREELAPVDGDDDVVAACFTATIAGLDSPDWVQVINALTMLRRLAVHHTGIACTAAHLADVVPRVVNAARNLRSALSKTAIMALRDLYLSCSGEELVPLTDIGGSTKPIGSVLAQLLLKAASNDKKFVIQEAQSTLVTMAEMLPPAAMLAMLIPGYVEHKNPKVRGKAATVAAACVARLQPEEAHEYGLASLLVAAAKLVTDNTPEAREGAKKMVMAVKTAFDDGGVAAKMNVHVPPPPPPSMSTEGEEDEVKEVTRWEFWCVSVLGPSKAAPVLKVVHVAS